MPSFSVPWTVEAGAYKPGAKQLSASAAYASAAPNSALSSAAPAAAAPAASAASALQLGTALLKDPAAAKHLEDLLQKVRAEQALVNAGCVGGPSMLSFL
jgi:hypothetical protein